MPSRCGARPPLLRVADRHDYLAARRPGLLGDSVATCLQRALQPERPQVVPHGLRPRRSQDLIAGTLSPELAQALQYGTAIGGARPRAVISDEEGGEWVAKFSLSTDLYPVVRAEAAGMRLAARVGIDVPEVRVTSAGGRDVLLVRRFDRAGDGTRRMMVSALTMLGFDDFLGARWSSYPELMDVLRKYAPSGTGLGRTVFERIAFNVLITNIDDHARNHGAFWDGVRLRSARRTAEPGGYRGARGWRAP